MLTVCQKSALSGFHYEAFDAHGLPVGEVVWPTWAQAKNARLRWHKPGSPEGDLQVRCTQGHYRIGFEYLTRAFANDVRFTLHQGGEPLAVAEVLFPPEKLKRAEIWLRQPLAAQLVPANHWTRARYRLEHEGQTLGWVEEPRALSFKRELRVDLPASLDLPTQLFIAFLMINSAFR
ncbi:hypothetical protein [Hydrogenophaga sp.]|uniref:hypothetical protein n=1 Tax=Hydrogenophaga sp. TaxID=1904254 RepID=UPI003F6BA336